MGELRQEFRPAIDNMVAGVILGLLMLGGACAIVYWIGKDVWQKGGRLPFFAEKDMSWVVVFLMSLLTFGLVLGGGFLLWWMRSLLSFRVHVHESGFVQCSSSKNECVGWSDVATMKEIVLYERLPLVKGPAKLLMPKVASRSYAVHCLDGRKFTFDVNSLKNVDQLGAILRNVSDDHGIPWEVEEVQG